MMRATEGWMDDELNEIVNHKKCSVPGILAFHLILSGKLCKTLVEIVGMTITSG